MKTVSGKEFAKILEKNGWALARVKGSHHIYFTKGKYVRISVPVNGKKPLKIGLQNHFMKIADLKEEDL